MKNKFLMQFAGSVVAAACLVSTHVSALPFVDGFDGYTFNTLLGQINPEGNPWAPAGTTNTDNMTVTNINLPYAGLECPGTNSLFFGGGTGPSERVAIHPPNGANAFIMGTGTIYYSFVFTVNNLLTLSTGGFVCGFNTLTGSQAGQPTVVGARLYVKSTDGVGYNIGLGKNPPSPNNAAFGPNEYNVGDTNFVVGSYTFVDGGTSNDYSQMWINPNPFTFGAAVPPVPDLTNNIGPDLQAAGANQIESFLFRQGNAQIPLFYVSNFRIGYCWACVTPPTNSAPYPSAMLSVTSPGTNSAAISWSTNVPCFQLQSSASLSPTNWTMVNGNFGLTANTNSFIVTNSVAGASTNNFAKYYRLKSILN